MMGYGNWGYPGYGYNYGYGMMAGWGMLLIPLLVWSLFWKGWALWQAAKNDSKPWFIALLVVNTMGILDILYIFVFGKSVKKSSKRK